MTNIQVIWGGDMWAGARGQLLRKPNENVSGLVARLSLQSILLQQTSHAAPCPKRIYNYLIVSLVVHMMQFSKLDTRYIAAWKTLFSALNT